MKAFDRDLVSGSITRSVWKLAWPLVMLNLVNGLHGFIDHILVGHFVGYEANAGIGVAWSIFLVIVVFVSSLFHGMSVLVARYAGKRDRTTVSNIAYHTFLAGVIILAAVAPAGYVLAPYLVRVANATPAVAEHALPYMRVLFLFGMPIFLMFMITGAIQASGQPRTPLALGVLATVLNIVLSTVLITGAGPFPKLGVTGAALATCIAPFVSVCIAIALIIRGKLIIQPPARFTLIPDWTILRAVARIGVPTGLQAVLLNLGSVLLLRYIGLLEHSAAAQAAYTICYAQLFSWVAWASWGLRNAASAVMSQNIGAGDMKRGEAGVHVAALFGGIWAIALGSIFLLFPRALLGLFGASEGPVYEFGSVLLRFLAVSGIFLTTSLGYTGGLIGAGETRRPMYIAFFAQFIVLLGLCRVWQLMGILDAHAIWRFILLGHVARMAATYAVFRGGKWRRIRIEIGQESEAHKPAPRRRRMRRAATLAVVGLIVGALVPPAIHRFEFPEATGACPSASDTVQVVAVQMHWDIEDYATPESFRAEADRLIRMGVERCDTSSPILVAFPEDVGTPLVLTGQLERVRDAGSLSEAVETLVRANLPQVLFYRYRYGVGMVRALFLSQAPRMGEVYVTTFSELARAHGVYLVAGTAPLPDFPLDHDGAAITFRVTSPNVYNTAYLFGPDGRLIGRQSKVHLVELEREAGLDLTPGTLERIDAWPTPFGAIGAAVCWDGFHEDVTNALLAKGAEILVQPSANYGSWNRAQQEDWLTGAWTLAQNHPRLRAVVNPMMTGSFFDLSFEGQSSVVCAADRARTPLHYADVPVDGGFLALAAGPFSEEILVARIGVPRPPENP